MSTAQSLKQTVDHFLTERGDFSADALSGKLARLHYVLDRMVSRRGQDSRAMTNARKRGSELVGFKRNMLRSHVSLVARKGSVEEALAFLGANTSREVWPVPPLDHDCIADVYVCEAVNFQGVYKVGFSTDVDQRLKDLRYTFKTTMRLVLKFQGTMFDEHLLQHDLRSFYLSGEWIDMDGRWAACDPAIPFYRPSAMWSALHASAANVSSVRENNSVEV